jgi:hypothetical protein
MLVVAPITMNQILAVKILVLAPILIQILATKTPALNRILAVKILVLAPILTQTIVASLTITTVAVITQVLLRATAMT